MVRTRPGRGQASHAGLVMDVTFARIGMSIDATGRPVSRFTGFSHPPRVTPRQATGVTITPMKEPIRVIVEGGDAADERRIAGILSTAPDIELVAPPAGGKLDRLTAREREILALVARAETNGAIAAELGITRRAVERHVNSIF